MLKDDVNGGGEVTKAKRKELQKEKKVIVKEENPEVDIKVKNGEEEIINYERIGYTRGKL